ncbi:AMP-binding protein [Myxococcaceae bacterium JPH2]|nr:AMP-binding protein [Myxococcaceae bacterium JPH2]
MSFGTLDDVLFRTRARAPEQPAIQSGNRQVTYREFAEAVGAFATGLHRAGVQRGDRVAIALPNGIDAAVAIYGTLRAGAAFVPLNPSIKADKLAAILANCSAAMLVCAPALLDMARQARERVPGLRITCASDDVPSGVAPFSALLSAPAEGEGPAHEEDLAAIIYTSGSTGTPKGVTLTHRNMVFAATSISTYLEMTAADRVLSVLPLSFDYGLYQLLLCVHVGATLLLEPGVGYPGRLISMLAEHQVTGLPGVPTLFRLLLSLPGLGERSWPSLRYVTNTGAALARDTIQMLRKTFPSASVYSMYGLTECKRVSYLPPAEIDRHPDSVGIAIPGTEVWVEDDAGRPVGPGEIGQLMVRGPHVMQGYWNDPTGTAERLREGRWPWERTLATGDLFRRDEDGLLYFVGRRDDLIKSRGERISPREVENVLLSAPGVFEAAVIGVPHELLGQAVCAHVAPRPGVELDIRELDRFCKARLEEHHAPHRFVIHAQLPTTPNGKIDKRALAENRTASPSERPAPSVETASTPPPARGSSSATGAPSPSPRPSDDVTNERALPRDPRRTLAPLLTQSRRLLGTRATDVPSGVYVADWLNISRFVEATGDDNPLYLDLRHGAQSWWRTMLAPPAFVLGIQAPESSGALHAHAHDAVEVLNHVDLWWDDHIKLGDRVGADLRIVGVDSGPDWRGRETVEVTSRASYRSEGRTVAHATGVVRVHPLRLGSELFVERKMHQYSAGEIERIEEGLSAEQPARGPLPRYASETAVGDALPQLVRGPFTWSELITWMIAEGRPAPAGNLRHALLQAHAGNVRPHGATHWPVSDRWHAREDLRACADVGFPSPCARAPFIVALAAQHVTSWMGDDAFLRHLSISLENHVLYGDTLWMDGRVTDVFVQRLGEREQSAVSVEVWGINQLGQRAFCATALVFLPEPGRPLLLPVAQESH